MTKNIDLRRSFRSSMWYHFLILFGVIFLAASCSDEDSAEIPTRPHVPYNPSVPVTVSTFSPDKGGAFTQVLIKGNNFGSDVSNINVTIDGTPLNVISSNGKELYVTIPKTLNSSGTINIEVGSGEQLQQVSTEGRYLYIPDPYVGTLAGKRPEHGEEDGIINGTIEEARFRQPTWLAFDRDKNIYITEEQNGTLRRISSDLKTVQSQFQGVSDFWRVRTITLTPDKTQMYIVVDRDNDRWASVAVIELKEENDFRNPEVAIRSLQCNGADCHPVNGELYYNSYSGGQVFRWDRQNYITQGDDRNQVNELFRIQDTDWEFVTQFHPSGDFAYITVKNKHYMLRSSYDWVNETLLPPVLFAGTPKSSGYRDGIGTNAKFDNPHQGAFVLEDDSFYICDERNHCIRKITSEGIVTTFAGRPQNYGYTDGALRDAQFDKPTGILYDEDIKTFYVADWENRRIRTIVMPNIEDTQVNE